MKTKLIFLIVLIVSPMLAFGECLFQVSTMSALAQGVYDGDYSYKQLAKRGNFGLGTLNRLDGEVVAVDGKFYQITATGKLNLVPSKELTPFAQVTFFNAKQKFEITNADDFGSVLRQLFKQMTNKNVPYAIRLDGDFANVKLRSIPAQTKPYPSLVEAVKQQSIFNLNKVSGTVVGFWFPAYWAGIAMPGYHLHFIDNDRTTGGHILNFSVIKARVALQPLDSVEVNLPNTAEFAAVNLSDPSIHAAIDQAEKNPPKRP